MWPCSLIFEIPFKLEGITLFFEGIKEGTEGLSPKEGNQGATDWIESKANN